MKRWLEEGLHMPTSWKSIAFVVVVAGITTSTAGAAEFPILGVFGDPKNDGCSSARAEEEGAYVALNKGGQTGENGEGGCIYRKIEPLPRANYRLTGTCSSLTGKPTKKVSKLGVIDKDQIIYDSTRYVRCR